jgi:hypothetical protein
MWMIVTAPFWVAALLGMAALFENYSLGNGTQEVSEL